MEIFIGFVYDNAKEKELSGINKGALQVAVNHYQTGFLSGLGTDVDVLSVLPVGYFPKRSKKLIFRRDLKQTRIGRIFYTPMIDLPAIRDIGIKQYLKKELSKRIKECKDSVVIYCYSLFIPFLKAMKCIKKKYRERVRYVLIVPDLPGKYGIMRKPLSLGGIKDRLTSKPRMELAKYADNYVFLTEHMKKLFPERPYCIIEGFLPFINYDNKEERIKHSVLYTGSLNAAFGIRKLLDAFSLIDDPTYSLWICGANGEQKEVEAAAKKDTRIKYFGFLPKQDIVKLQSKCDILINPRSNTDLYTKYSFPSKTMEYLLSGSKVVMYRLSGVPEEYYDYVYTIIGESAESIKKAILLAGEDVNFYEHRSKEQVCWISENKNAKKQISVMKKILVR